MNITYKFRPDISYKKYGLSQIVKFGDCLKQLDNIRVSSVAIVVTSPPYDLRKPYGKYKDRLLIDLPESYVVWLSHKGFPEGRLGDMLKTVYEIKLNGLEYLFKPLRGK